MATNIKGDKMGKKINQKIYTGSKWDMNRYENLVCKKGERLSKYIDTKKFMIQEDNT